jgi:hypothetical protein
MGCKECKKKKKSGKDFDIEVDLESPVQKVLSNADKVPDGTFFLKIIAIVAVIVTLPLVIVFVLMQVILGLLAPKILEKITIKKWVDSFLLALGNRKVKNEQKKRDKQFADTVDYNDIEIFEEENKNVVKEK